MRQIIQGANVVGQIGGAMTKTGAGLILAGAATSEVPVVGAPLAAGGAFVTTGGLVFQGVADVSRLGAAAVLWAQGDAQPFQAAAYQSFYDALGYRLDVPDLPVNGLPDPAEAGIQAFAGEDPCP